MVRIMYTQNIKLNLNLIFQNQGVSKTMVLGETEVNKIF